MIGARLGPFHLRLFWGQTGQGQVVQLVEAIRRPVDHILWFLDHFNLFLSIFFLNLWGSKLVTTGLFDNKFGKRF